MRSKPPCGSRTVWRVPRFISLRWVRSAPPTSSATRCSAGPTAATCFRAASSPARTRWPPPTPFRAQVAEKLGLPQVTYAEEILEVREGALVIKRRLEHGTEVVECPIPAVVTVNASAAECRPRNAKRVMKYKGALAGSEIAAAPESPAAQRAAAKEYLRIVEWAAADVDPDPAQLGLQGSPTKVKRIENVVFAAKEAKKLTAADNDINELMVELIASHTLG